MMEDYSTKNITSPKVKKEFILPEGWSMIEKRGRWCVRDLNGKLHKFLSKDEAKKYIEEMS